MSSMAVPMITVRTGTVSDCDKFGPLQVKACPWRPERVVFSHGRWFDRDGAAALERAFRWLLG